jgi:hypothetical protein
MTSPTPTANPYAPIQVTPTVHSSTGGAAMPATVSTATSSSVIAAGAQRNATHNAVVLGQSGRIVRGGSKRTMFKRSKRSTKRTMFKRSKRSTKRTMFKRSTKRSTKRSKCKRTMFKRSKRGGVPTPGPSPGPSVMPVPQFAGAHNAGANANSLASNRVLTNAAAQSAFDNPDATASNTKVF